MSNSKTEIAKKGQAAPVRVRSMARPPSGLAKDACMKHNSIDTSEGPKSHGQTPDEGRSAARGRSRTQEILETLGTLSLRTAMGNGPRRLQPWRDSLGIFSARSRALPGIPMG